MRAPVSEVVGVLAVMPTANINTDQIIPSAWLRTATADLGKGLFGAQRYGADGAEKPDFVLNRPPFRSARILLADENFGCGSSREAAVWALVQFGFGCVLAPSFADIFYENAFRNGLVAGVVDAATYEDLKAAAAQAGDPVFRVDVASRTIAGPDGQSRRFEIPAYRAQALMRGEDEIAATLRLADEIDAHRAARTTGSPWLFPERLMRRTEG